MKRHDRKGQVTVDIKIECLMNLAYRSIIEGQPLQMQRVYIKTVFFDYLKSQETVLPLDEIIHAGLLLEVNEFLVEWPHASFRDYLAGRLLFDLIETDKPLDIFPFEKPNGAAAAAHATRLATTQSRRLEKRSTIFLALLHRYPSLGAMKIVAEEYCTSLEYYTSTHQDLKCDVDKYREIQWGERFLESYQLIVDIARRNGLPGVDGIPSPKGLTIFFGPEADFCVMLFSEKKGLHFDQLQNFEDWTLRSQKRNKPSTGFCLFAPFLLLLDPEIMAYLQVGVWLRLRANKAQIELNEWHNGLATYISPKNEWINWSQPEEIPKPKFDLCANPQQTFQILQQTYGSAQVNQLQMTTDILINSRIEFLSWEEIYSPITFQIDPTKVQESPKLISNRLGQMMVLTPPRHHISLALLMPLSYKTDRGVRIFVPFPIPLLNRYYFCNSITASDNLRLSFVHMMG